MPRERFNDQDKQQLSAWFQRRNEAQFAWKSISSAHLALPGTRATWTMGSVGYIQPECLDISGNGNHLQASAALGNVTFTYDGLMPLASFAGAANQYLLRVDAGAGNWADILGTEAQIFASHRGLTLGGWFFWAALPGVQQYLMAKDDVGANRQYVLFLLNTDLIAFVVFLGGIAVTASAVIRVGWNHIVGKYDQASQTLFVYVNGVQTSGGVGAAPALLADTAAPFTVGADGAGGNRFTGNASHCFLSAVSIPAVNIGATYEQTRAGYGA